MVPSRGTCTLLASHRGRGSGARGAGSCRAEGCRRGRTGCVREPTLGQMPHRPARRTRDSAALRRPMLGSPGCCHPPRPRASPATPVHSGILASLSVAAVWTWAGKRPCPTPPPCPPSPPTPSRPGRARPQDSGRGCQGDIFSGAARFQHPPPAQLAGSLSTFLQTGSQAVTGCEAARGLGESSAYGGALAGASGPGVLGCSNPARLAANSVGSALPGPPSHFSCGQLLSRAHSNSIARVSRSSCKLAMHRAYLTSHKETTPVCLVPRALVSMFYPPAR